ncbi:MAG: hypothetical protein ACR2OU_20895 [Thermomicrobiales bacterium]
MPTFKNTSDHVFQDGDLLVKPDESFSTDEESRMVQLRGQYAWQFSESKSEDAPTEAEVKADPIDVRPLVGDAFVQIDDEGKQSKKIG